MPCNDDRDSVRTVYKDGFDPYFQEEAKRLSARCHELTTLLCSAGRARYNKTEIPIAVLKWWDEHCQIDKNRGEPW